MGLGLGLELGLGLVKCLGRAVSAHIVLQHVRHAQERGAEGVGVLRRRPAVGEYDDAQSVVLAGAWRVHGRVHGVCKDPRMARAVRVQCVCSA